jgi:hypothetical protein
VRITSAEWKGERWFNSVPLALFAHGIAFVALSIALARPGTPLKLPPRVASRAHAEHLRFVAPASPAPTLRNGPIGRHAPQRRLTTDIPRPTLTPPDTNTSITAASLPSSPAARPTVGALATALAVDPRLLVVPGAMTDTRLHDVNLAIATGVRAVNDSLARIRRGWTVGDSTHRVGIAPCGVEVWVVCIPFGLGSMPNPARPRIGIDPTRANEAEVRAAIARIRAKDSQSSGGAPEPAGP